MTAHAVFRIDRLDPEVVTAIDQIAARIEREFFGILSKEDLTQEFYLWLCEKPSRANAWMHRKKGEDGEPVGEELFGWQSFRRDCAAVMARAARREKAQRVGYEVEDEVFYGRAQIKVLLILVW